MEISQKKARRGMLFLLGMASILAGAACQRKSAPEPSAGTWFNLSHLNRLYEEVNIGGRDMAIVHIYSEFPDYKWVDAGDEGIACVDDAARAAVVYLRHFELTGDTTSLGHAKKLLEFCRYMQAEDGLFYNFIFADHRINRDGRTSRKSLDWWTARGIWALGEGYRIFALVDSSYAAQLQQHVVKVFPHLDTLQAHYPQIDTVNGFLMPRWLLLNGAADATSELMLGLANYAKASHDERAKTYLRKFARGLIAMQLGDAKTFPFGAFLSWQNNWHGWGNSQTQALATMAGFMPEEAIWQPAQKEADGFYRYWQAHGVLRQVEFARKPELAIARADTFAQIAYALRPMIVGCIRLAEITGDDRYAERAADLATWFFGNNLAKAQMYDPATGRGYDGILSRTEINRNAGAESTIEALYSILEVEHHPAARRRLVAVIGGQ